MLDDKPQIILLEDDPHTRKILKATLMYKGFKVYEASHLEEGIKKLHKTSATVVGFVDVDLKEGNGQTGIDFIKYASANAGDRAMMYAYTGDARFETHEAALDAGAQGFLVKPLPPKIILRYVERAAQVLRGTRVDSLTGLLNATGFAELVKPKLEESSSRGEPRVVSLLLIDIDRFKAGVNERYGYLAGDEAIRTLAKLLVAKTRPADPVCRRGGDEFMIALFDVDEETANGHGLLIEDVVAKTAIELPNGPPLNIEISFGVGSLSAEEISRYAGVDGAYTALGEMSDKGPRGIKAHRRRKSYVGR
jgi:diguanylate cyclase (GGDEF)-like protein